MAYARFLVRRLLQAIPVVIGVTVIVFFLIHLVPGNPARAALGIHATPKAIEALDRKWGLSGSLPAQYLLFMEHLLSGNLGTSLRYEQSAGALVSERMPATLWLLVYSTVLTCILAVPIALWAASRQGGMRDRVIRVLSVLALGVPTFWLGLILIRYVALETQLFPSAGFGEGFGGHLTALFLPSLAISAGIVPLVVRSLRAEILKVSESDFVTTARAKGLSESKIRIRHILRNALAPSITVLAVNISFLVGDTLVVEQVFSVGGVGTLMLQAVENRDFPIVQAVTLVLAMVVVVVNMLGDLAQAFLDPRVEAR